MLGMADFGDSKMQQLIRMPQGGVANESAGDGKVVCNLPHNNLKHPEKKGILKKHPYSLVMGDGKEDWMQRALAENILATENVVTDQPSVSDVERTLKSLNGYHDDILQALRNAASHRGSTTTPTGSSTVLNDDILMRSLQNYPDFKRSSSQEHVCGPQSNDGDGEEDEVVDVPPCRPIQIRNLEDLIRQLQHHTRHTSPCGSEDIRMSETDVDRHYRQESSSACSESSHQSQRDSRFVYGGRYRHPPGRLSYPHPHHHLEEESIYESADHDRGAPCGDTPDSESDEFIQAQQLARWASEEAVGQAGTSGGSSTREYFPSPSSSASEEPPTIARAPVPAPPVAPVHPDHATIHRPKRYPEYKH